MPNIQQLSSSIVNQIAAGEVVERPASVVKELIENAIDAHARRIDVVIEKGGSDLIRITDDGCGIEPQQLVLALASHATSKIETADDLFSVQTLGFRGEALASIASISRLTIRSRVRDAAEGAQIEVVGSEVGEMVPCGCPIGTTLEVRHLFFNTPVRRKFLRTTQTEMGHCSEVFTRLALANPQIQFTLSHNGRTLHDLPPTDHWRDRIAIFFGEELASDLIPVQNTDGGVTLSGYVANPSHTRGNNRWQYLFLNGRVIRDRSLQHSLSEAYRGLILTGRYPICFLNIAMPPEVVDVNVHPTKLEVRFQDAGSLYSQLLGTLRERFLTTDLTARINPDGASPAAAMPSAADSMGKESELVDWAKGELASQGSPSQGSPGSVPQSQFGWPASSSASSTGRAPLRLNRIDVPAFRPFDPSGHEPIGGHGSTGSPTRETKSSHGGVPGELESQEGETETSMATEHGASRRTPAIQIHNRYLIAESEDGVVVIDQHALHERILYEQIRDKVLDGELESQNLLVPEPVDLSATEAAAVLDHSDLLAKLGVRVEPFGGETVLVSSYPAMSANMNPADVVRGLAEQLIADAGVPEPRDLLDELLHMISCKAAIKAGDRLTLEEVESLIEQRHLVQDSHHCPHGRPTTLVFTREELDRQFKRI